MSGHAKLSPSGSKKWINCPGSVKMEQGVEETFSPYAATGTAAHYLAECMFENRKAGFNTTDYMGRSLVVTEDTVFWSDQSKPSEGEEHFVVEVDQDMFDKVYGYVQDILADRDQWGAQLFVENKLDISGITGEEGAVGTCDVVMVSPGTIDIRDLKYGHNPVKAEGNTQLAIYAGAALQEFGDFEKFERVRMGIHMPNLGTVEVVEMSVTELEEWLESISAAASISKYLLETDTDDLFKNLLPGNHCQEGYCKARPFCKALHDDIVDFCDFEALPEITSEVNKIPVERMAYILTKKKQAEDWLKQIESHVEKLLKNGEEVPYHKLVQGKQGNRQWDDIKAVEETLKGMSGIKVDDMYDKKLISPTTAGKLAAKKIIGPKQWKQLQGYIVRPEGKLKVVHVSEPGERITPEDRASDFEVLD